MQDYALSVTILHDTCYYECECWLSTFTLIMVNSTAFMVLDMLSNHSHTVTIFRRFFVC